MMNLLNKQAELTRTLFQINMNTAQEIFKHQQEDLQKYFELNADFSEKLPQVDGFTGLVELQRSYAETIWNGIRESGQTQANIVRAAVEQAGEAVRTVYTPEETVA